jgi:hypothetical protein
VDILNKEPFIPLGDEAIPQKGYRILSTKRPPLPLGTEQFLNPNYVPLMAEARRARAKLIEKLEQTQDPRIIVELVRQELQEIPFIEGLQAVFGKKRANWRTMLIWEAKHDPLARDELARLLSDASTSDDPKESELFREAEGAVRRLRSRGLWDRSRAAGIFFTLSYLCNMGRWPTRPMVKGMLKKMDCNFPASERGNNDRRFFSGPVLGRVRTGKPGAPRGPRPEKD